MAKIDTFKCSVVTPEEAVLECEASFVAIPAHDGEIGILRNRAPLVCKLDVGALRIHQADGKPVVFYVDGGFAEMAGNHLTVLTADARKPEDIDLEAVAESLEAARRLAIDDEAAFERRQRALRRARVQKRLAVDS
jgi:F-type H+-transporting ATPase subunit epsilon